MKKNNNRRWIPHVVIEELEDLKMEHNIDSDAKAFRKMSDYVRVGREVERLTKFKFNHKPTKKRDRRGFF